MGWTGVEQKRKVAQGQILRERYPEAFGSCTAKLRKEQNSVISLGDYDQQVFTLRTCYEQAQAQSPIDFNPQYVLPDGSGTSKFSTLTNEVYEDFSIRPLSYDLWPQVTKQQMGNCLRDLSWDTAGMASYVSDLVVERSLNLVHEVHVPPVHVLYQDWRVVKTRELKSWI